MLEKISFGHTYYRLLKPIFKNLDLDELLHGEAIVIGMIMESFISNKLVPKYGRHYDLGADRKSLLINIGGGVVTDLGGFVASTFKRGISYVNVLLPY